MLDRVKLALRISHHLLDSEIEETIESARAEMVRSGVSRDKANQDKDVLIAKAIKTYCLASLTSEPKTAEGYQRSWEYQLDNLRKSSAYAESGDYNV